MARLLIEPPSQVEGQSALVEEGSALLIGRDPSADQISQDTLKTQRLETLHVNVASVSANHLLVQQTGGQTTFVDLGSRNGSWLRLPPGKPVTVQADEIMVVRLSSAHGDPQREELPEQLSWTTLEGFQTALETAIRAWLDRRRVPARVSSVRGRRTGSLQINEIPTSDGYTLQIVPERTVDVHWSHTMTAIWRWVEQQRSHYAAEDDARREGMILSSPAIRAVHRRVVEAARRGLRLVLIGPSGSGKDGLARCYHRHTGRAGAFVAKNCSMFSRELLRSELFGAEQGAFTTAVRRIVGAVETAHGGTLFLDELAEMAADVQPLLLTFLDRGEYERMGSYGVSRSADVRIVAATNRDLRAATLEGKFREDLWYRLAGCVVEVPPLGERPEDVEAYLRLRPLSDTIDAFAALSGDGRNWALSYAWPGGFRMLAAFADLLPRDAALESIDEQSCAELAARISLERERRSLPAAAPSSANLDLQRAATLAGQAYEADHDNNSLTNWDSVKEYLERYLKPLLFAELSGANSLGRRDDADVPALAFKLEADRGTVVKQLSRFFERFVG